MSLPRALVAVSWLGIAAAGCSRDTPPAPAPQSPAPPAASPAPADGSPPAAAPARQVDILPTPHGELRITPIRHATVLFEIAGRAIYVDPVGDVDYDGLPPATAVFLTHDHHDHLDPAGLAKVVTDDTVVIAAKAIADKLPDTLHHVTLLGPGEVSGSKSAIVPALGMWFGVEAIPAYNLKRGPKPEKLYHPRGHGVGYVLDFGGVRVYVSGDTACTDEMRALRDIDVALVCMNLPYTMPPSEAAECIAAFRPRIVYPYHYRGSDLGPLDALAEKGIEVRKRSWY